MGRMRPALHGLNDRTGRQKEQGFEEGVRHQMEHSSHVSAHPHRGYHKAQLADGGVSQHLLDIRLGQRDGSGKESRRRSHPGHGHLRGRDQSVESRAARHQINPRRHHRGGMDQC